MGDFSDESPYFCVLVGWNHLTTTEFVDHWLGHWLSSRNTCIRRIWYTYSQAVSCHPGRFKTRGVNWDNFPNYCIPKLQMEKQICMCLYVVVPLYHPAKIGVYWYPIIVAMNIPAPIFHLNSACKLMPTTGSHRHFILSWSTARLFGCSIQNTSNDLTLGPSL